LHFTAPPHPNFASQNPPVSPVGSVGGKRLPSASIAPQGEGFSLRRGSAEGGGEV